MSDTGPDIAASPAEPGAEPLIVSVSGLRGVVGESLTPEVAARYAAAGGIQISASHNPARYNG